MTDREPTYHPEELERAVREDGMVALHRLYRYDHLSHDIPLGALVDVDVTIEHESRDREARGESLDVFKTQKHIPTTNGSCGSARGRCDRMGRPRRNAHA